MGPGPGSLCSGGLGQRGIKGARGGRRLYDITLYRLLVYRTVVEEQSFRRAASRLGISQPAVSAHIRGLEAMVGLKLLERTSGRTSTPTEAGEIVYTYALETTLNTAALEATLKQMRDGEAGSLVMGASATLGKHVLPPIFARFRDQHPKVSIQLRVGMQNTILKHVMRGEVDFGLVLTYGNIEGLISEHLTNEELLLVVGKNHPLASRRHVTAEEVASHDFVTGLVTSMYHKAIQQRLESVGIPIRSIAMQLEQADAIAAVVAQGMGIGTLLRCTVADDLRSGRLVELKVAGLGPLWIEIRLVYRARRYIVAPVTQQFLACLREGLRSRGLAPAGAAPIKETVAGAS